MKIISPVKAPMLKSDQLVLTQIRKASREDPFGWGLEQDEICEYTNLKLDTVFQALVRLRKKKLVTIKVSNVANHIFYCDPEMLANAS